MPYLRFAFPLILAGALTVPALAPVLAQDPAQALAQAPAQDQGTPTDSSKQHHALSLIGEPEYPAGFTHFKFVDPDAPKGGIVRLADIGGFDSLNPILYKGEAAAGVGLVYESLMSDSIDEPSTAYGLIAESASYPAD